MTPGLTRKDATVELTRETVGNQTDTGPPLSSIAMSAGGRYLAVTTVRTHFALPALQLVGEPRPVPGPRELYVVDLQDRTLERVTHSAYRRRHQRRGARRPDDLSGWRAHCLLLVCQQPLLWRRQPALRRIRGDPAARTRRGPAGSRLRRRWPGATIEFDRGGPQIGVQARSRPGGEILLLVSVPAAGGVKAVARARAGEPRKPAP